MKERPILFSAPMVRAILDGRKTQTRRTVKAGNSLVDGRRGGLADLDLANAWVDRGPSPAGNPGPYLKAPHRTEGTCHRIYPTWQPGDRLWIRETWQAVHAYVDYESGYVDALSWPKAIPKDDKGGWWRPTYAADGGPDSKGERGFPWRPAIYMPRWASRITLEVTGVRVERLHDITEEDARAEGVLNDHGAVNQTMPDTARRRFADLWREINGAESWDANPWVWVVEFRRVEAGGMLLAEGE